VCLQPSNQASDFWCSSNLPTPSEGSTECGQLAGLRGTGSTLLHVPRHTLENDLERAVRLVEIASIFFGFYRGKSLQTSQPIISTMNSRVSRTETCRYDLRVTRPSMHVMFLGKVWQFTRLSAVQCSDEVRITQHVYMVRGTGFGLEIYQRFTSTSQISSLRDNLDLMVCAQNCRYTATTSITQCSKL
jgi:hypothetical protein